MHETPDVALYVPQSSEIAGHATLVEALPYLKSDWSIEEMRRSSR